VSDDPPWGAIKIAIALGSTWIPAFAGKSGKKNIWE
jgi:hypothetical protein